MTGYLLNRRISDKLFSNIVYIGTFVLGWYLLWIGGARSWHVMHGA